MEPDASHLFLAKAEHADLAVNQVLHFLDNTQLVAYAERRVVTEEILSAMDARFRAAADNGVARNRAFVGRMMQDLRKGGVGSLEDLEELEQGYLSKTLHVLVHMLDGFIGIDSRFYNLVEDSHWISAQLTRAIEREPSLYWLIPVQAGAVTATLLHS